MIPNRHRLALDPAERLAESADQHRLREAARATGNWSVLNILAALADEARRRKKDMAHPTVGVPSAYHALTRKNKGHQKVA